MVEKQINNNISLLFDCHVFDGKFQGTRTYIQGLYSEMIKHQDINFFFAANDIENLEKMFGNAVNIKYIKLNYTGSIKRLAIEFPIIISDYGIDYAHFQYFSYVVELFGIQHLDTIVYGCPLFYSNVTFMAEYEIPEKKIFNPKNINELNNKIKDSLKDHQYVIINCSIRNKINWKRIVDILYENNIIDLREKIQIYVTIVLKKIVFLEERRAA